MWPKAHHPTRQQYQEQDHPEAGLQPSWSLSDGAIVDTCFLLQFPELGRQLEDCRFFGVLVQLADELSVCLQMLWEWQLLQGCGVQGRTSQVILLLIVVATLVEHHVLDAVSHFLGQVTHDTVGMLLILLVIRLQGYGVADAPEEIGTDVEIVAVMVGGRYDLHVLLPAVALGSVEGHAHGTCRKPVQIVTLCMSCLREHDDGKPRIDTFGHDIERFEVVLQTFSTLPSEAEGRQQTDPVEKPCEHRVHGEHVRPCQCADMLSLWQ